MRYAIDVAPLGDELADPLTIVRLARAAEASGWDGFSIWDSTGVSMGTVAPDPFVALAAVAATTERLQLILSVIALPRRRPQLVAQATSTLDRLSGGRVVLGVGAGGDPGDFESFGESFDRSTRLTAMDEAIGLVDAFLRGSTVSHEGPLYRVHGVAVGPRPTQQPRPPLWFGGMRPAALRRAAALDGWIAIAVTEDGSSIDLPPDAFGDLVARVHAERTALDRGNEPFDVAVFAFSDPGAIGNELARGYAEAGATWWLESLSGLRGSVDDLVARVEAGPPRPG
jgi:alkanesulfonate monooxygenase SsuD/methylene tetrahydromethanopterin reductase-like flavin-dependent oxidoreductase (luciferase family)